VIEDNLNTCRDVAAGFFIAVCPVLCNGHLLPTLGVAPCPVGGMSNGCASNVAKGQIFQDVAR
jgi:hypothetical protein